jgi:hypothetical protein
MLFDGTGHGYQKAHLSAQDGAIDNDETPEENFDKFKRQVEHVFPGSSPNTPWVVSGNNPSISILMIPFNLERGRIHIRRGTLELQCYDIAKSPNPRVASNTDKFMDDLEAGSFDAMRWSNTRFGKAWLRSNLAARGDDPCAQLGELFRDQSNLFNRRDPSIDVIVNFLANLI